VLTEAISCFLEQDYPNRELIILNNHPVPLVCDLPQVTVYNEPGYASLGDCRNRLLELANGKLVRTWDDDDLYMPWAISQGVENIGDAPAWKPYQSWGWRMDRDDVYLSGNTYEASWTTRTNVARRFGYLGLSGGNEHNSLEAGIKSLGGIVKGKVKPSYVYRWGSGLCRISGSLDKNDLSEERVKARTERWMKMNDDTGNGKPIEPVDMSQYWDRFERAWEEANGLD
jgi:glycosyltransferase involved in cell wall biosynthesis